MMATIGQFRLHFWNARVETVNPIVKRDRGMQLQRMGPLSPHLIKDLMSSNLLIILFSYPVSCY